MQKRKLGQTEIEVAPLAFGGNVFGWTIDEPTSFQLLDAFTDAGLNLIDTADVYSAWVPGHKGGESETIIGKWLKKSGRRDRVVIATKVGMDMGPLGKGLGREHILKSVDASLKRLQTDHIDLYQSHKDDTETPLEETLEAYAHLIKQGKIRAIGASNYEAPRLAEALKVGRSRDLPVYRTLQPQYNLMEREGFEKELEPLCVKEKIAVISYFSLASGFLTGKYRTEADLNKSQRGGSAKKYLTPRGLNVLAALDKVADKYHSKPSSVALAWLMQRPAVTAPIASATSVDQLKDLVAACELKLDAESVAALDKASS